MRRNKSEIFIDVLKAVKITSVPTQIMSKSNLTWNRTQQIFSDMLDKNLIRVDLTWFYSQRYFLTDKGNNFLHLHCNKNKNKSRGFAVR